MSKTTNPPKPTPDHIPPGHPRPKHRGIVFLLMALYQFANNGQFSGRMDGNVMQRNGRSRAWKYPALIRNAYTMLQRGRLASMSSLYATLNAAQVLAWQAFQYVSGSDRFGNPIINTSKNAFVALNCNLLDAGRPTISDPPVLVGCVGILTATLAAAAGAGTMTLAFTATPTDTTTIHLVFMTSPTTSRARSRPVSKFKMCAVIAGATASPANLAAAYTTRYGSFAGQAGQRVFFQLWAVNKATGQKVASVGGSVIIAA